MERYIYLPILGIGIIFGGVVFFSHRADLGWLKERYLAESHERSAVVAERVERAFAEVYRGLRTIARLPGVRAIGADRSGKASDGAGNRLEDDARQTVQEVYNSFAEDAPLWTVYVVPVDLQPDPLAGHFQGPLAAFHRVVADDQSPPRGEDPGRRAGSADGSNTAELAGFFLIEKQLQRMLDQVPVAENVKGLDLPAELTCLDTADQGRSGLIYSVPSYGPDGSLDGCISGVILTGVLRQLLTEGAYAISGADGFLLQPDDQTFSEETLQRVNQGEPDPELIYSEVIPLKIVDEAGRWGLWAGRPDALFWGLPEVRRAGRGANLGYLGALVLVGGLATVTFLTRRNSRELVEKNLQLEQWIEARTADLRAEQDTAQAATQAEVRHKKEALARQTQAEVSPAEGTEVAGTKAIQAKEKAEVAAKPKEKPPAAETEQASRLDADRKWLWQREHTIPSKSEAGQVIIEEVLKQLEQQGWPRRDVFGVHLAMSEAMTNAIKHGNGQDPGKKVRIVSGLAADFLRIRITDEGPGFDPALLPDPTAPENLEAASGRGVMVMRSYMTRVEFPDPGNTVLMEKDHREDD